MAAHHLPWTSEQAYLEAERKAEVRSEYCNGQVLAIAGGTYAHAVIITRTAHELLTALGGRDCQVSVTELRLQVSPEHMYAYPDIMVICGNPQFADGEKDMITNPVLIIEVLSKSTEAYDRGDKFAYYRGVPTLRQYILIAQDRPRVESYVRQSDETWNYSSVEGRDAVVEMTALGGQLRLDRLYEGVPGV